MMNSGTTGQENVEAHGKTSRGQELGAQSGSRQKLRRVTCEFESPLRHHNSLDIHNFQYYNGLSIDDHGRYKASDQLVTTPCGRFKVGTIYKRGRNWFVDVRAKGRRIRKKVGPDKRTAELTLKDYEVQIAKDEFGFAKRDIAIDIFFDRCLEYSNSQNREKTTERYANVIENFKSYLSGHSNVTFLSEITQEHLDRFKGYRRGTLNAPQEGSARPAKSNTVNYELTVLRLLFNLGMKWGYLTENPTRGIEKLKVEDAKPPRFLSEDEIASFLAACPPRLKDIYFTFLQTGMRKAELENLEWSDIDLRSKRIRIQRKPFWQPKTGERDIPISTLLLDVLKRMESTNRRGANGQWVFCEDDGSQLSIKLRERLIRVANKAGITDFTSVHSLRHTFASQLVMKGVDLPTVQKLLGHSEIETTMVYAHLAPDHLAEAVNKLNGTKSSVPLTPTPSKCKKG